MRKQWLFGAFFLFLLLLIPLANSRDWWLDIAFFAILYITLWLLERKFPQDDRTILLLVLIPIPHLLGAFGLYHWELGGVSWDVLVHITTAFLGVLFLHSLTRSMDRWKTAATIIVIVLLAGGMIEAIEAVGGEALKREGEGLFYRGAGDFCTAACPCSDVVDTEKDTVDNITGLALGIIAVLILAQRGDGQRARRSSVRRRHR